MTGRFQLAQSVVQACLWMSSMADHLPEVLRRPLFQELTDDGGSRLVYLGNSIDKRIPNFTAWAQGHGASFAAIQAAYGLAAGEHAEAAEFQRHPYMARATRGPELVGTYRSQQQYEVEAAPLGYEATCASEQVATSRCNLTKRGSFAC